MENVKIKFPIKEKLTIEIEKEVDRINNTVFSRDYFYILLKMYQLTCNDANVLTIVDKNDVKYKYLKVNALTKDAVNVSNRIFHSNIRDYTDETHIILLNDIKEITFIHDCYL